MPPVGGGAAPEKAPKRAWGADPVQAGGEVDSQGGRNGIPERGTGGPKREVSGGVAERSREGHVGSGHDSGTGTRRGRCSGWGGGP